MVEGRLPMKASLKVIDSNPQIIMCIIGSNTKIQLHSELIRFREIIKVMTDRYFLDDGILIARGALGYHSWKGTTPTDVQVWVRIPVSPVCHLITRVPKWSHVT